MLNKLEMTHLAPGTHQRWDEINRVDRYVFCTDRQDDYNTIGGGGGGGLKYMTLV